MPLTAAEKQKQYRERMRLQNPEKFEEAKRKNSERNKKRKKISECTEDDKEKLRQNWRERKKRQKINKDISVRPDHNSVETNCNLSQNDMVRRAVLAERKRLYRKWLEEKATYRSKIKKYMSMIISLKQKYYRSVSQNKNLLALIHNLKRKVLQSQSQEDTTNATDTIRKEKEITPLSKTNMFIQNNLCNVPEEEKQKIKKVLFNHNVLVSAVKNTYQSTTNNNERNLLKKIVDNEIVTKYRNKSKFTLLLGLKGKIRRNMQIKKRNKKIITEIMQFYQRDDVSRATAGKKEVKTVKKDKRQRRYLLKPLKELFKKYREEGGKAKYSSFKKYRPFYVLHPKLTDRETCGCIKHENFRLKIEKLYTLKLIDSKNVEEIIKKVCCNLDSKDCAYGTCSECEEKEILFHWENYSRAEIITWEEFALENHEYINKSDGNKKTVAKKMVKRQKTDRLELLTDSFVEDLKTMTKHVFNIKHQYAQYLQCINNLKHTEVALHVDFSENYVCKLVTEVQSMHFGASKSQVTIHTGVLYANDKKSQSFASISPNNEHGPEAIWAHLEPVLQYIKKQYPKVISIHIFSDGPTSQYKQKKNFYLFCKRTKELGFLYSTWNFSEASHGKGAADGVGAGVKRRLDNCVSLGLDVPNALVAYEILQKSDTSILTFFISDSDIEKNQVAVDLTPVPQTMLLHQITNMESANTIRFRCLSCFCNKSISYRGYCDCLEPKEHQLLIESKKNNLKRKKFNYKEIEHKKNRMHEETVQKTEIKNNDEVCPIEEIRTNSPKLYSKEHEKVTMLSKVRIVSENKVYLNLNHFDPFKCNKIDKTFDIYTGHVKKQNVYESPVPSTSKKNKIQTKNLLKTDDISTSDNDEYSVHDTSDEDLTFDDVEDKKNEDEQVHSEEGKSGHSCEKLAKILEFVNTEVQGAPEIHEGTVEVTDKLHFLRNKTEGRCANENDCNVLNTKKEYLYGVDESVIVRYYQRKSWKYYVGFIECINKDEEGDTSYTVRFLKTIKKPTIKFITSKKNDRDVVSEISLVKKIELRFDSKEYFLKDISNEVFF